MNKYQAFALSKTEFAIYKGEDLRQDRIGRAKGNWGKINKTGIIDVKQDANYNILKYFLRFNENVKSVEYSGKKYEQITSGDSSHPYVLVPLDFNDKDTKMILNFGKVVDEVEVKINFIDADKSIYDEIQRKEKASDFEIKASIKIATGESLVNIYFQPCSADYGRTEVELYLANGKYSTPPSVMGKHDVWRPSLLSATPGQLLGKFKVDDGAMFKSITGLARGAYGVKISQYDDKGNLLFTSDYQYFHIH